MKTSCLLFFAALLLTGAVRAQDDADAPATTALKRYIRARMDARQERADKARSGRPAPPPYAGLPDTVSPTLPEDEGFVRDRRFPGEQVVADVSGLDAAGLTLPDVIEDEEWARLPDGARIRRDRSRGYEIWHYPPGTRLIHRIFLKSDHRLIELRMLQKQDDDASGDGPWAFGVYRPDRGLYALTLYQERGGRPESVSLPLPGRFGRFTWTRLPLSSCRDCHASMGDGWYQYADRDRAGPCGFVPLNPALLTRWAAHYQRRHGYYPFIGP